ncbi:hypothetical protein TNIN_175101 [Trichonephila inaurata madagascariensis]|uniref:Uncharacterized protein n=1 Tax=Trichonephila inaurata madagascariensis TaxID=2747483 RepID=A0A8X7C3E6_9ARAC|nr:hypothetical protein TNIN_175101 [Trichonephila inaurata madagascariensis]
MELIMENHHTNGTNGEQDPSLIQYESSLYKFKDERDAIQKKTFTKWVNKHLKKVSAETKPLSRARCVGNQDPAPFVFSRSLEQ